MLSALDLHPRGTAAGAEEALDRHQGEFSCGTWPAADVSARNAWFPAVSEAGELQKKGQTQGRVQDTN